MPDTKKDILSVFSNSVGEYGYDPWGFNIAGIKPLLSFGKTIYEKYFRVEVHGGENIPPTGRVLIIANHSGQLPIDGFLLGYSVLINPHAPRAAKGMMEKFIPTVPFISEMFSQFGGVVGDPINCKRMLQNEEAIIVFPEGSKGISKPFSKRYKLQKFGNGFMHLAIENKTPIIPVGIVGCEETIISLGNLKVFEKILKLPSAPLLLPFVLPSKVIINIGEPMYFEGEDMHEEKVTEKVNLVKDQINKLINIGLAQRKGIFAK